MWGWLFTGLIVTVTAFAPLAVRAQESVSAQLALAELETAEFTNAYLPFARHALGEAVKRESGGLLRSAVLVRQVSLIDPKSIACEGKPLAAIIDLDIAPGTPAEMEIEPQSGFAYLLDTLRTSGIDIAWLAEASETRLAPVTDLLREGDAPVMRGEDIILVGLPGSATKQERRQQLARDYCIVAIAGDRRGDFDELYDYLRDQSYAIRLEAYIDRGWFLLPHPVTAIDSARLQIPQKEPISPEQKAE